MDMKTQFDQWFAANKASEPTRLVIKRYSDVFTRMTPVMLLEKAVTEGMFTVELLASTIACATVGQPPSEWNQNGTSAEHDAFLAAVFVPETMKDTGASTIVRLILAEYDMETLFEVTRAVLVLAGHNELRESKDVV